MRILIVSNLFPPDYDGGLEINAWKIARALRARGHDVQAVTSKFRPGFQPKEPDPDWVHRIFDFLIPIPDVKKGKAARFEVMGKLAARVRIGRPNGAALTRHLEAMPRYDLVYPFGLHQIGLSTMLPAAEAKLATMWHCGDHFIADHFAQVHISRLYRLMLEKVLKKDTDREKQVDFRHMAFVSRFLLEHFIEKDFRPANPYIIPRGVDFNLGVDVDRQRDNLFFMACRIDPTKGVHHGVEAARQLACIAPELDWRLEIAGTGDAEYRRTLEKQIEVEGLAARVRFIGKLTREETLAKIRNARAFLSTSVWGEPFANTIIETLGSGTPLIGAVAGSILEVVEPDVSALTYERNSPGELAVHMERILRDSDKARDLAEQGLTVIRERYTLDKIMDLTEATFEKVIASYSGGRA